MASIIPLNLTINNLGLYFNIKVPYPRRYGNWRNIDDDTPIDRDANGVTIFKDGIAYLYNHECHKDKCVLMIVKLGDNKLSVQISIILGLISVYYNDKRLSHEEIQELGDKPIVQLLRQQSTKSAR